MVRLIVIRVRATARVISESFDEFTVVDYGSVGTLRGGFLLVSNAKVISGP